MFVCYMLQKCRWVVCALRPDLSALHSSICLAWISIASSAL